MANVLTNLIVLLSVGVLGVLAERCCLPGEVLTKEHQCRSLKTNVERPISLSCPNPELVDDLDFFINDQGQLQFPVPNRIVAYEPNTYCDAILVDERKSSHVALLCREPKKNIDDDVFGYCMGVSAIFLIITAANYAIRGLHRDLFGKSVINLCVSLAFGLMLLMALKVMPYSDMNMCAVRGFSAYYFLLVSYFWMNVISIQTLVSRRHGVSPDTVHSGEKMTYIISAVYAWGVPAVFTAITAVVNFMPGDHLKPGIGLNTCWFFDMRQQWQYFYSIMSVLTLVNVIVFGAVTAHICCDGNSHSEPFKQKFSSCVRLFVVMGIPWAFEMIDSLTPPHLAWEIIDLFNALQGLWIFLVLVQTPKPTKPEDNSQYKINIISSEPPYCKLEK